MTEKKIKKKVASKKENPEEKVKEKGLKNEWILFIDEYMQNGFNGGKAYAKVYKVSNNVGRASAPRLLANPSISKEIEYRFNSQRCTESFVVDGLVDIATRYRGSKTINAAVKSLEILARVKGMLVDTKKIAFTGENPALFPSLVKPENAKKFQEEVDRGERIVE